MRATTEKSGGENQRRASAESIAGKARAGAASLVEHGANRPEAVAQRRLEGLANQSAQATSTARYQSLLNGGPQRRTDPVQRQDGATVVQAKLVELPDGNVALDEEVDSIVNEGTEKYKVVHKSNAGLWLEDDWGDIWIYDTATSTKLNESTTVEKVGKMLTMMNLMRQPLGQQLKAHLKNLHYWNGVVRAYSPAVQDLAPDLIAHSAKTYGSGTVTLTPTIIASGSHGGYQFDVSTAILKVSFGETDLGRLTITEPKTKTSLLKVGELDVGTSYRGMNLSRVLMVMLAQKAVACSGGKYSVGQDTDITNKGFWNQYSNNAVTLLQRGDHQTIDVPAKPLG
jgi:hypothetical protein